MVSRKTFTMTRPQNAADCAAVWWKNKWLDDRTLALLDRTRFDAVIHTVNTGERAEAPFLRP